MHYASLDAYVLIDIMKALIKKARDEKKIDYTKCLKTLDNRNILIDDESGGIMNDDDFYEKEDIKRQKLNNEKIKNINFK